MSGTQDIFGDPQNEPDISTDSLEWEADDTFDSVRGESLPTDEGDVDTSQQPDEDPQVDEQDEADKGEAPADPADDLPEAFRGKTQAELVKIINDSQSMVDKQGNEIGELRRAVEQIQAQREQQQQAAQHVPVAEYIQDAQDGLLAYREGIALLDQQQIGPEAIDEIIDAVREFDPTTAAKMDRDFGMRLARAEMNVQMEPVIQQSYDLALREATQRVNADPDAEAYREDIVRIVQSPTTLMEQQVAVAYQQARTSADIANVLTAALQVARGANPIKSTLYKQQLDAAKQNEQVEGGNSAPADPAPTEADRIKQSLLKKYDGSDSIFAGFGAS